MYQESNAIEEDGGGGGDGGGGSGAPANNTSGIAGINGDPPGRKGILNPMVRRPKIKITHDDYTKLARSEGSLTYVSKLGISDALANEIHETMKDPLVMLLDLEAPNGSLITIKGSPITSN